MIFFPGSVTQRSHFEFWLKIDSALGDGCQGQKRQSEGNRLVAGCFRHFR